MIKSKRAEEKDFDAFFFLKCDEENINWTGHKNAPERENLYSWFIKNINNPIRHFFIFFEDENFEQPIGYLYVDYVNEEQTVVDTGHGVYSGSAGKGYGTQIINFAVEFARNQLDSVNEIEGWIAEANIGSIKNVLKNGYSETSETKVVTFEGGDSKVFKKFSKELRKNT